MLTLPSPMHWFVYLSVSQAISSKQVRMFDCIATPLTLPSLTIDQVLVLVISLVEFTMWISLNRFIVMVTFHFVYWNLPVILVNSNSCLTLDKASLVRLNKATNIGIFFFDMQ